MAVPVLQYKGVKPGDVWHMAAAFKPAGTGTAGIVAGATDFSLLRELSIVEFNILCNLLPPPDQQYEMMQLMQTDNLYDFAYAVAKDAAILSWNLSSCINQKQ